MMLVPALSNAAGFSPESRVWIYTAGRPLTPAEAKGVQQALDIFVGQWTAHNEALKAAAEIFENQFIVLMVDESRAGASGCSIDKSVHFLEKLGAELGIDFFERMRFAWVQNDQLQFADRDALQQAVLSRTIGEETLMVNTLVQNKSELASNWLVPFSRSWHRRLV